MISRKTVKNHRFGRSILPQKGNGLAEKASPLRVAPRDDVADVSQSWLGLALTV